MNFAAWCFIKRSISDVTGNILLSYQLQSMYTMQIIQMDVTQVHNLEDCRCNNKVKGGRCRLSGVMKCREQIGNITNSKDRYCIHIYHMRTTKKDWHADQSEKSTGFW